MYEQQRAFGRPAMVAHDPRRLGFEYTNQPGSVHPTTRTYGIPGPSRRPLPTPRPRPESMPPPLRDAPLVVQAPAPSRPAILAPSATLPTSPTAPARRPLPTPVLTPSRPSTKHASIDLTARPTSPAKSPIHPHADRDVCIPSSFSRRTAPLPDPAHAPAAAFSTPPPTWPQATPLSTFPALRNPYSPTASSAPVGTHVIERRSTVSAATPPTVLPGRAESPQRVQPASRPLPSSPTEPPRIPSLHQRISASSDDENDISSPSDISSLSDQDAYEPITFADPMRVDGDEHESMFARNTRTPSPRYGIRDLPPRSRMAIANRDDTKNANAALQQAQPIWPRAARSATLPQPPISSPNTLQGQSQAISPHSPRISPPASTPSAPLSNRNPSSGSPTAEPQSLTLRFASISLAEERERERQTQQAAPGPSLAQSPTRPVPGPTSPLRHQHAWPANIAPLPRTPGNTSRPFFGTADLPILKSQSSNGTSSSSPASLPTSPTHPGRPFPSSPNLDATFDRKSFAQHSPQQQQQPQLQQASPLSERQLQTQRPRNADINLDDAPPPSLRRSPSPIRQGSAHAPIIEITNDTPPRRQWTPGQDVTSQISNASGNGVASRAPSRSPERRVKPRTQPQIHPPVQSPTLPEQTAIPRISLPDGNHHNDGAVDDNDAFGPSIVVSGPGSGPRVSVTTPGTPAISVSEAPIVVHRAPSISVSSTDAPSVAFSPPKVSVSDSAQPQRAAPSSGSFGSRHTQIQEPSASHSTPGRGPGCKRGLPALPTSSTVRTNGLSCGGCNGPIIGRIVSAMGQRWHPNCFKCTICNELLEHVSSYERDGKPYCHLDYHEAFAPRCFHCKTAIIDERFITLDDPALGKRTYHEQHFFCAECGDPFLAPSGPLPSSFTRSGELNLMGDGEFVDDDVGFTVYKGHPYCEACHVRLRMPKCKGCKKSIRDGVRAVEALGAKWCWGCFVCEGCQKPFEDPSFFLRKEKPFCEPCFSLILRNEL